MAHSIPDGLTRAHVEMALAELDSGINHPFGEPTGYEVLEKGRSYAPKAVIGVASRHLIGRMLNPDEFSSGVAPGQAVYTLRLLGFNVVRMGDDWTPEEVSLIVADYFDMLRLELLAIPFSKTEHRGTLAPQLHERSKGSIEFKHQNISAVLVQRGLPYIDGYKPRGNFQSILGTTVDEYLSAHDGFFESLADAARLNPREAPSLPQIAVGALFVSPPERMTELQQPSKPWLSRRGRKIDFASRDAENRRLGRFGEQWVVDVERRRLTALGRDDLASRVEWVADTIGDGLGYDVLSFDHEGETERMIEVKTTGLGKYFPFLVTPNEVRCSEDLADQFHLYRVFSFSSHARVYDLHGAITSTCDIVPALYSARPRGAE